MLLWACLAAAPQARAEVRYRLEPSLRLGGGWSSDLFLGADLGPSLQGQLVPALAVDVSAAPRVKLFGSYECALGLYEATLGTAVSNDLTLGTRIRLAPGLWAQVSVEAEAEDLSVSQAVGDVVGLQASTTLGASAHPGLRWWGGPFLLELFGSFGYRHYLLEGGQPIDGTSVGGGLAVGAGLGPVRLSLAVRGFSEQADDPGFSYDGGGASVSVGATPGGVVDLRLGAAAYRNLFARGRADWLARASFAPSVRVVEGVWVEAAYGYAVNFSSEPAFDASRHFVYLGVRVERVWRN